MCDFRIWMQVHPDVYVVECVECNTMQVRYKNIAVILTRENFGLFQDSVNLAYHALQYDGAATHYTIPSLSNGLDMSIRADDLRCLHSLLDRTDTEMKVLQMANMF